MTAAAAGVVAVLIAAAVLALISTPDKENHLMEHDVNDTGPIHQPDLAGRPTPVRDAAVDTAKIVGILSTVLTGLVGFGTLTVVQADALTGLLGLIPGVVAGALTAWSAMRTATRSEHRVTPIDDPMKVISGRLVPLVADRR